MAEKTPSLPALAPAQTENRGSFLARKHVWGGIIIVIVAVFVIGWLIICYKRKLYAGCKLRRNGKGKLDAGKMWSRRFQLEELQKATNNFSQDCLVGTGAFGNVYRGSFEAEGVLAIKKLHPSSCTSIEEFRNGSRAEKIMVYEYVSNGSLLDYIMGRGGKSLTWRQRVNIAIGAAKGIAHLHEGVKPSIIHRDIKPSNILVSENFEAKVSDFGLVKSGPVGDQSHVSSQVKGTPGYLDPAYCASFHLSPFTDVYSFGVILLQLVTARPAVDSSRKHPNIHVVDWARSSLERGRVDEIIDANLLLEECNMEIMLKMGQLGLRCVVEMPKEKPTMTQVWQELETALDSVEIFMPKQSSLYSAELSGFRSGSTGYRDRGSIDNGHSQSSISIDGIGLQKFHVDMDSHSLRSSSLTCFEHSINMDAAAKNLRGIAEEISISMDEDKVARANEFSLDYDVSMICHCPL
ncbi:probable serine/threonine-protein kinase PBL9 [Coffea eugenioides]|uniref:probable serine/threonine-protein kinase PBL9 n=1 Tax=Coffea eugenioides TaxID=49369 RepID=UPI000F607B71|nr:probable serine/threonine-protein kinase PBL9 [Coffea eugenioides]